MGLLLDSELIGFEHNDVEDLERLLKKQAEEDKKVSRLLHMLLASGQACCSMDLP